MGAVVAGKPGGATPSRDKGEATTRLPRNRGATRKGGAMLRIIYTPFALDGGEWPRVALELIQTTYPAPGTRAQIETGLFLQRMVAEILGRYIGEPGEHDGRDAESFEEKYGGELYPLPVPAGAVAMVRAAADRLGLDFYSQTYFSIPEDGVSLAWFAEADVADKPEPWRAAFIEQSIRFAAADTLRLAQAAGAACNDAGTRHRAAQDADTAAGHELRDCRRASPDYKRHEAALVAVRPAAALLASAAWSVVDTLAEAKRRDAEAIAAQAAAAELPAEDAGMPDAHWAPCGNSAASRV